MFELGFSDVLSMAQTIGIVGTMIMTHISLDKYKVYH